MGVLGSMPTLADGRLLWRETATVTYLEPLAHSPALRDRVHTGTAVSHVGRRGFLKEECPGDPRRGQLDDADNRLKHYLDVYHAEMRRVFPLDDREPMVSCCCAE